MSEVGRILRSARNATAGVVDVLFPDRCWVSSQAVGADSPHLSAEVRQEIACAQLVNFCRRCGSTLGPYERHDRKSPCQRCPGRDIGVGTLARVGAFAPPLSGLVHRIKFGRSWELAGVIAPFLLQALSRVSEEQKVPVDAILPLPLHWRRRAQRGFNQAEELARELCGLGKWPLLQPLRRVKHTHEQARIHYKTRRQENMAGAFVCRPESRLQGKHVWLLDDVCTTGATLHAAATAIRKLAPAIRPASINAVVLCVTDRAAPAQVEELDSDDVPDDQSTATSGH